jgi:hypothetical protein
VLFGIVYGIKHGHPAIWQAWFEAAQRRGVAGTDDAMLVQYFGSRREVGRLACSGLVESFMQLTEEFEGT